MFAARPIRMEAATVLAVRGHGTLAGLECASKETVFLGDPGPLCHLFARRTAKRYKLGVIPHATERDHPNIRELVSQSGENPLHRRVRPVS